MASLREHQKVKVADMIRRHRALVVLPYGYGKTVVSLSATDFFARASEKGCEHIFVACPPRNIPTWTTQIVAWLPGIPVYVNRLPDSTEAPGVILFSQMRLASALQMILGFFLRFPGTPLIMDESTKIKNPKAKITKAALRLTEALPEDTVIYALTGNACPESPKELWSQLAFCKLTDRNIGDTYYRFLRKWFILTDRGYVLRSETMVEFWEAITAKCVYLTLEERKTLQQSWQQEEPLYIRELYEPSKEQLLYMELLKKHWVLPEEHLSLEQLKEAIANPAAIPHTQLKYSAAILAKEQQMASGFFYPLDAEGMPVVFDLQPKLDLLLEILQELTEGNLLPVIIWYRYVAEREMISHALTLRNIPFCIGPDEEALKKFESRQCPVILMGAAVSQGFNELAGAQTAIFYTNMHSQELRDQAVARNTGARQQWPIVRVIDIGGIGCLDQAIIELLIAKNLTPAKLKALIRTRPSQLPIPEEESCS